MQLLAFSAVDLLGAATEQYTARTHTDGLLHVSEVVKDLAATTRSAADNARFSKPPEPGDRLKWAVGIAFEEILLKAFGDPQSPLYDPSMDRPGELELDGIVGTPDWLTVEDWPDGERAGVRWKAGSALVLGESKATWFSSNAFSIEDKAFTWLWQVKAYCKLTGARIVRFYVLFVNGDYKYGNSPEPGCHFRVWEETFTDREINDHWAMLTAHAARMRARKETTCR